MTKKSFNNGKSQAVMAFDADALDDGGLDAGVFRKRVEKPLDACYSPI